MAGSTCLWARGGWEGKSKHKCWFELQEKLELSCLEIGQQQQLIFGRLSCVEPLGHLDSGPGGVGLSPGCVDSI